MAMSQMELAATSAFLGGLFGSLFATPVAEWTEEYIGEKRFTTLSGVIIIIGLAAIALNK